MSGTPNLDLTYLTSGQLQPEVTINDDLNALDALLAGAEVIALAGANVTLTTAQAENRIIRLQGTLTANVVVYFPASLTLEWVISNETTGAYTVNVEVTGGTSAVAVTQGTAIIAYSNGTNMVAASGSGGGAGTVTSVALSMPADFTITGSPVTTSGTLTAVYASQSANLVFASPNGASGTPAFRSLVAADVPQLTATQMPAFSGDATSTAGTSALTLAASGVTAGTYGSGSLVPVLTVDAKGRVTALTTAAASSGFANPMTTQYDIIVGGTSGAATRFGAPTAAGTYGLQFNPSTGFAYATWPAGGGGTVTSVGLVDSTGLFTVTGSPVTASGNLTLSALASQAANTFLAAPNGAAGAPTMRAMVAADVPQLTATQMPAFTGDATSTAGTSALTLASSGVTPGTYGDASHTLTATVDGKGRITAISTNAITGGGGTTFTFTPQAAPTLVPGITWGDSTQNALQTYVDGVKGWLPTVIMLSTTRYTVSLVAATATNILPLSYIGSLSLPANFFVVGKTLRITVRGYIYTKPSAYAIISPSVVIGSTTLGGANNGNGISTTATIFSIEYTITCNGAGTNGTLMAALNAHSDGNQSTLPNTSTIWSDGNGNSVAFNTTLASTVSLMLNASEALTLAINLVMIEVIA